MTNLVGRSVFLAGLLVIAFGLSACDDKGPMEQAGEDMDEAIDDAGRALEDATD